MTRKQYIGIMAVAAFAGLAAAGFWHLLGGMSAMESVMGHCPLTPGASVCLMTLVDHIGSWQSLFSATLASAVFLGVLLLVFIAVRFSTVASGNSPGAGHRSRREYALARASVPQSVFERALSRGVIHPKLFSLSVR